jgi:ABC-type branched-subunit amino acid transport system substrate-binding protein
MFSRRTFGRNFAMAALALALAACQTGPRTRPGPAPAPTPTPTGPAENVLPTDTARHRVALLVPMSGENAAVGRSIANAATMALLDTNAQNLRMTTYDTGTNPGGAAATAIRDGNKLILGPLLREDVAGVLSQARPAKVPVVTFSNDTSVAEPDVFVMGHVPEQSIDRTVRYARAQGVRRFAALAPNGDYGNRAVAALQQSVTAAGGTYAGAERYDRGNTSIISAANRLKAKGGYDAVLIPDSVRVAASGATTLAAGAAKPRILGTELWSGETALASSVPLRGAWFSAVSDARYRQFVTSYQARFGEQPYRIATLGYDAVLLTLRIARDWQPGRNFPLNRIVAPDGFLGLDGPFRFRANGVGERMMEVRVVGNGAVTVADPAPAKF